MATKRKRTASNDAVTTSSSKRSAIDHNVRDPSDQAAVDDELSSINDLLQDEETSQKRNLRPISHGYGTLLKLLMGFSFV